MNSNVSIRLSFNQATVECEASENFILNELPDLITRLTPTLQEQATKPINQSPQEDIELEVFNTTGTGRLDFSLNSIAKKLQVKTGSDLAMAVCAFFDTVQGRESFSRDDIRTEMQKVPRFCGKNMPKNLGSYLNTLVNKGELLERANGQFVLSDTKRTQLLDALNGEAV